jgi:primosomal protein N' (replication factor Y)
VTFDLLMQAAGRSGRGDSAGDVILQVYEPDHYAVQCAVQQDYPAFFAHEMRFRHAGQYPPYVDMIALTFSGSTQKEADEAAADMKQALTGSFKVIGVVSLLRLKDRCRSRIIMKGKDLKEMQDAVRNYIDSAGSSLRGLRIDVNPLYLD